MRRLGALPLMHQPGEKWMYHTGSDVLGVLIARASGQDFSDFLRERIFVPLGMKDTDFLCRSRSGTASLRAICAIPRRTNLRSMTIRTRAAGASRPHSSQAAAGSFRPPTT